MMNQKHVCPWWLGYFLLNPVRKYMHSPEQILGPFIKPGMNVIDYGSAMGFFSLPMAKMVGNAGKVHCFDVQEKMLDKLVSRAKNAGLENIVVPHLVYDHITGFSELTQSIDFALLFAVAHEVPDRKQLFRFLYGMMKNKSLLLFSEPSGHVSEKDFEQSVSYAENAGFRKLNPLKIKREYSILLEKNE